MLYYNSIVFNTNINIINDFVSLINNIYIIKLYTNNIYEY